MAEVIEILDTTLRDGEQSPGVALTASDKVEIAKQLERLGVDIIEAGFPLTSEGDLEAVAQGLKEVLDESYLAYRIRSTQYLGDRIVAAGRYRRGFQRGRTRRPRAA